jgi:YHS domain-containing protein
MKIWALIVAAVTLLSAGCATDAKGVRQETQAEAQTQTQTQPESGAVQARVVPPGESKVGDRTTCPVSGEEFVVAEDTERFEHQGRTYHVCCDSCLEDLAANPEKFLGRAR